MTLAFCHLILVLQFCLSVGFPVTGSDFAHDLLTLFHSLSFAWAALPRSPLTSRLCTLSSETQPFVTPFLELHRSPCLLSPLCPSCAVSTSVAELLKDTSLPSSLFSCVSAFPRTQNRIALFFTFLTSPRTVSMIS